MNETRIAVLRQEQGWTQERLAAESGIAVRTVQRLEAGQDASLETLSSVAGALRVAVRELFVVVDGQELSARVEALALRTELQQGARDRTVRAGLWLWLGGGAVMLPISIAVNHLGAALLLLYFVGGGVVLWALRLYLFEPRMDEKYPLSRRTRLFRFEAVPSPAQHGSAPVEVRE